MTYWTELVELYEYRVADLLAGRVPRGGRRSLAELRGVLLAAPLDPALCRRLRRSDRHYRAHQRGDTLEAVLPVPPARPEAALSGWSAPASGDPAEAHAWQELRHLMWHAALQTRLAQWGDALQHEPGNLSLRVLYAALETADRGARGIAPGLAVPAAGDPLVALHRPEVAQGLLLALADHLATPEGQTRLRAALSSVQETPFPRHADADVLAARLHAARREPLAPQAREALVQALRAPYPGERDPRERPAIREAALRLQQTLDALLEAAPAPTLAGPGDVPARSILYAAHAPTALPAPDDAADDLTIHLRGGQRAHWRGMDLRWVPTGPNWQVQVDGEMALLRPGRPAAGRVQPLQTPGPALRLAVSGAYLRLQVLARPAREGDEALARLAARARVVAALLDPGLHYAHLRLARATAQHLRGGQVDAAALGPQSAGRYVSAPPDTLLALACKGAAALISRAARLTPADLETALGGCAAALDLPPETPDRLAALLHAARTPDALPAPQHLTRAEVPHNGQFLRLRLGEQPLTLLLPGRALTLRADGRGDLAVLLPGLPDATLRDLLVLRLPDADLLLVRHGEDVAAAVQPAGDGDAPQAGEAQRGRPTFFSDR